jgi:hypothetical protein
MESYTDTQDSQFFHILSKCVQAVSEGASIHATGPEAK